MSIIPKGAQAEVLALEPKGHTVVLGTAGSGKTTMALLRAEHLSNFADRPNVLVVTFNRALVAYMRNIHASQRSVKVEHFHRWALGYLKSAGKETDYVVLSKSKDKKDIIDSILIAGRAKHPAESTLFRPVQTFVEEIQFIQRFGVRTLEEYEKIERVGRADTNIRRENRKWFFAVYKKYIELRTQKGYLYDWDDVATFAYDALTEDARPRLYKHIIVDEGQDFSPMMLKALVNAVPADGTFTYFGDVAQQIYGHALSWKFSGINVQSRINEQKKIWRFENNYRNPYEVAVFAQDITKHELWEAKGEEYVTPKFERPAAGLKPTLVKYRDNTAETSALIQLLNGRSGRNVVIVKNWDIVDELIQHLNSRAIRASAIRKDTNRSVADGIYITTFHSAKGLEFDGVYIPYLNDEDFPDSEKLGAAESKYSVYANALKLFYVAVTRAIQSVVMSYSCELTRLFPVDSENYYIVDRSEE